MWKKEGKKEERKAILGRERPEKLILLHKSSRVKASSSGVDPFVVLVLSTN